MVPPNGTCRRPPSRHCGRSVERNDIIKRIHRGLAEQHIERSVGDFALDEGEHTPPIIGRLVARGLDDELNATAYAVIDGVDGRTHHIRLPDLDATS